MHIGAMRHRSGVLHIRTQIHMEVVLEFQAMMTHLVNMQRDFPEV